MKYSMYNWGPLLYLTQVEENMLQQFDDITSSLTIENDYRAHLAGKIDNEYRFEEQQSLYAANLLKGYFKHYFYTVTQEWDSGLYQEFQYDYDKLKYLCSDMWVNFQKAKEFNPPHSHGMDYSFVLYLDVPEEIHKEKYTQINNTIPPGAIQFKFGEDVASDADSKFRQPRLPIVRNSYLPTRGDMFIFPSYLTHWVNSFDSNVTRISISGNFTVTE